MRQLLERLPAPVADPPATAPALVILEARRRQRLRRLRVVLVAVLGLAAVGAAGGVLGTGPDGTPSGSHGLPTGLPPDVMTALAGMALLLRPPGSLPADVWPDGVGGPAAPNEQPVLVEDLGTGRLSVHALPGTERGGSRLSLMGVGRYLVYWSAAGVTALPSSLAGRSRTLGTAAYVAPSSAPGQVWLVRSHGRSIEPVSVGTGHHGAVVELPSGTSLVQGTDAGLLLDTRRGALELWQPGRAPRTVAGVGPAPRRVFASGRRVVAYGAGCRYGVRVGSSDEAVCRMLRVVDLASGVRLSFPAPPGSLGWVPPATTTNDLSPGGATLTADAWVADGRSTQTEVFVISLTGDRHPVVPVLSLPGWRYERAAWSPRGSALLCQGPRHHLAVFVPATGRRYVTALPWSTTSVAVAAVPERSG